MINLIYLQPLQFNINMLCFPQRLHSNGFIPSTFKLQNTMNSKIFKARL